MNNINTHTTMSTYPSFPVCYSPEPWLQDNSERCSSCGPLCHQFGADDTAHHHSHHEVNATIEATTYLVLLLCYCTRFIIFSNIGVQLSQITTLARCRVLGGPPPPKKTPQQQPKKKTLGPSSKCLCHRKILIKLLHAHN